MRRSGFCAGLGLLGERLDDLRRDVEEEDGGDEREREDDDDERVPA